MRPLTIVVTLLLLAALAFIFLSQRNVKLGIRHQANISDNSNVETSQTKLLQSTNNIRPEVGRTSEEKKSSLDRLLDQLPTSLQAKRTPEMDRRTIERVNQAREPEYRALFESWDLDESTANSALEIIHDREFKMMENSSAFFRLGRSYMPEYKAREMADEAVAESLLTSLLGSERFEELSQMEQDRMSKVKKSLGIAE